MAWMVIAASFERIQRGEPIALDELVADRDALAGELLSFAGLQARVAAQPD